eukprot:776784-Amphidinium_carterae.1
MLEPRGNHTCDAVRDCACNLLKNFWQSKACPGSGSISRPHLLGYRSHVAEAPSHVDSMGRCSPVRARITPMSSESSLPSTDSLSTWGLHL